MDASFTTTLAYGQRLLPRLIDERADQGWQRPWACIPRSKDLSQGFRDITYREYSNAIDRCAYWIKDNIGISTTFEPLVYFPGAALDIRYQILVMAAVKTGHIMFFVSPRNSIDAHVSLLQESAAIRIIVPEAEPAALPALLERCSIEKVTIPELGYFLDVELTLPPLRLFGDFSKWRGKPMLMLHTSGSTGIPKVILIKHGYFETCDAFHLRPGGHAIGQRAGSMRVFMPFPAFHITGLSWSIAIGVFIDSTIVLPPAVPITSDLVSQVHQFGNVEYSSLQPSVIVDMSKNPEQLKSLIRLKGVSFVGGPLPQETGDSISSMTHLHSSMGSTEAFTFPQLHKDATDWQWFNFDQDGCGFRFDEVESGIFEMVIMKDSHKSLFQAVFITFPDLAEYRTKDLYERHPVKQHLWRHVGRSDDIIVFSNGEKLNPITMEGIIAACPTIQACLIVGQGRFQTVLIVEPMPNIDRSTLSDTLWPFVEKANQSCVTHGRIARDMILITKSEKPLARAGKGTVIRGQSNKLYAYEIDEVYQRAESNKSTSSTVTAIDCGTLDVTMRTLQAFLVFETGLDHVGPDDDIINLGVDSLQLINLNRAMNNASRGQRIEPKHMYENPTIRQLAMLLQDQSVVVEDRWTSEEEDEEAWRTMEKMYQDMVKSLPGYRPPRARLLRLHTTPVWLPPSDGGLVAWSQVIGSFLVNMNTWGLILSWGAFAAFYESAYLSEYAADTISWIGTLQGAMSLIAGVISGPLFDMGHFRSILIIAGTLTVLSLMLLSLTTGQYYQIMLIQGVLIGISGGFLYIPSVALIPLYFKKKRGLALGLATAGGSFGGVLYPLIFRSLLNRAGFPWATRGIAFVSLVTLFMATMLIRPLEVTKRPIRKLIDTTAFKQRNFVAFMVVAFLIYAGVLVPFFLGSTFAEHIGASTNFAFYTQSILNAAQFFGRIMAGLFSDYMVESSFGTESLLLTTEYILGVMGLCWIAVRSVSGLVVFDLIYGFCTGFITTLPAVIIPYLSPSLAVLGTRIGMVYGSAGLGFLISAPVAGAAATATGGFLGAQLWCGLCLLVGASVFATMTWPEARRRRVTAERERDVNKMHELEVEK